MMRCRSDQETTPTTTSNRSTIGTALIRRSARMAAISATDALPEAVMTSVVITLRIGQCDMVLLLFCPGGPGRGGFGRMPVPEPSAESDVRRHVSILDNAQPARQVHGAQTAPAIDCRRPARLRWNAGRGLAAPVIVGGAQAWETAVAGGARPGRRRCRRTAGWWRW